MKNGISKNDNMLELIPSLNGNINWNESAEGTVTLIIPRNGFFDRLVRIFHKTPEQVRIDLDKIGSFVWKSINGKNSIYDIGEMLKSEFGNEIEPVYERLLIHINILRNNKFISLKKASDQNA